MAAPVPDTLCARPDVFKVLLIGDASVGKTSLLCRFTENIFDEAYPEFEFKTRVMTIKGRQVKVVLWDTAGQERFRTLTSGSYRGVQGVLVVYAKNDPSSFSNVPQWLAEVKRYAQNPDVVRMLIGNKSDLPEQTVPTESAKTFAAENQMPFFETSAKTNTNVQQAFDTLINMIFEKEVPSAPAAEKPGCKCVLL